MSIPPNSTRPTHADARRGATRRNCGRNPKHRQTHCNGGDLLAPLAIGNAAGTYPNGGGLPRFARQRIPPAQVAPIIIMSCRRLAPLARRRCGVAPLPHWLVPPVPSSLCCWASLFRVAAGCFLRPSISCNPAALARAGSPSAHARCSPPARRRLGGRVGPGGARPRGRPVRGSVPSFPLWRAPPSGRWVPRSALRSPSGLLLLLCRRYPNARPSGRPVAGWVPAENLPNRTPAAPPPGRLRRPS